MTRLALIAVLGGLGGGCLASDDARGVDAGANAAPAITAVHADRVELSEFATVTFERGTGSLDLVLYDTDRDDTLFAKVFVDYSPTAPTPARSSCRTTDPSVERSCTLDLGDLCHADDAGKNLVMQVLVFDRQVLDVGEPLYQAMPPGGLTTSRTYFLVCQEPST